MDLFLTKMYVKQKKLGLFGGAGGGGTDEGIYYFLFPA